MKTFAKQSNCPTSHQILSYVQGSLRPLAQKRVARHCALCDFCGAEAQLLARYEPSDEACAPAATPALITVLGVQLPVRRTSAVPARRAA